MFRREGEDNKRRLSDWKDEEVAHYFLERFVLFKSSLPLNQALF